MAPGDDKPPPDPTEAPECALQSAPPAVKDPSPCPRGSDSGVTARPPAQGEPSELGRAPTAPARTHFVLDT